MKMVSFPLFILLTLYSLLCRSSFVFISGDDSDDAGHCETAESCGGLMVTMIQTSIDESTVEDATVDVLAVGIRSSNALDAFNNWQQSIGFSYDIITTAQAVLNVDFSHYRVIYLPSAETHTTGGVTCALLATFNTRSLEIISYVNDLGGSIMALTQDGCTDQASYGWLSQPLTTITIFDEFLTVTSYLQGIIPSLSATALDHCCYHTAYTGPSGYGGLNILATRLDGTPVILGGLNIILSAEICDDGVDNDEDGLIDFLDLDCLETNCDDGIDNNANLLADCDDPNCQSFWQPCVELIQAQQRQGSRVCQGTIEIFNRTEVLCHQYKGFEDYILFPAINVTSENVTLHTAHTLLDTRINCNEPSAEDYSQHILLEVSHMQSTSTFQDAFMLQKFLVDEVDMGLFRGAFLFQKSGIGSGNITITPIVPEWNSTASCDSVPTTDLDCSAVAPIIVNRVFGWNIINVTDIFRCQYPITEELNLRWDGGSSTTRQIWHTGSNSIPPVLIIYAAVPSE